MSLRSKLVLILAGVITLYGALHLVVQWTVVFPSFGRLEKREAQDDLHRVLEAIRNEVTHLDTTCHDWAAWDDTYDFIESGSPEYVEANLQNSSLESARVDVMYFVGLDGTVVHRAMREPADGGSPPDLPEFPEGKQRLDDPLRCVQGVDEARSGILATAAAPILVSSRPIVKSSREGPVRGYLVFGRILDAPAVARLASQTNVQFKLFLLSRPDLLTRGARTGLEEVQRNQGEAVLSVDSQMLNAYASVPDMSGQPAVLVEAELPRALMNQGRRAIAFALWSTVGAGVLILCVLAWVLQRVVVNPLAKLTAHTVSIGRLDDLDTHLHLNRKDEIGVLSREIDAMCDELASSRAHLMDSAHRAGMSQVAADVLHNVGNVLNSVHVSTREIQERLQRMEIDDLASISACLHQRSGNLDDFVTKDPQGREVLAYLGLLSRRLAEERAGLLSESNDLSESLSHMHQLVRTQQDLAGGEEPIVVSLAGEIETAIRISAARTSRSVEIVRDFASLPRVRLQKHRLLQILVNLLKNARESVEIADVEHPRIEIRLAPSTDGTRFRLEIGDNGVGIAPNRLSAVFTYGQTTKQGGHGLGLHASANAAREMGGSISVRSAGIGRGAIFSLELPLVAEVAAA